MRHNYLIKKSSHNHNPNTTPNNPKPQIVTKSLQISSPTTNQHQDTTNTQTHTDPHPNAYKNAPTHTHKHPQNIVAPCAPITTYIKGKAVLEYRYMPQIRGTMPPQLAPRLTLTLHNRVRLTSLRGDYLFDARGLTYSLPRYFF